MDQAACSTCHRDGDQRGAIGPDLAAVATRCKRQDLLESATERPNVLSAQYLHTAIETTDVRVIIGRITEETTDKVVIRPNPLEPETVTVRKSAIESRQFSQVSRRKLPAYAANPKMKQWQTNGYGLSRYCCTNSMGRLATASPAPATP